MFTSYFMNLEDPDSAMHYCDQAREAAQEARNTELGIYSLCMMSHFASQQGKDHDELAEPVRIREAQAQGELRVRVGLGELAFPA